MTRSWIRGLPFALWCSVIGCGPSAEPHAAGKWPPGVPPPSATPLASAPAPIESATPEAALPTADDAPPGIAGVLHPLASSNLPGMGFIGWQRGMPVVSQNSWGPKIMCGVDASGKYVLDERDWQGVDTSVLVESVGDMAQRSLLIGFSDTGRAVGAGQLYVRERGGRWKEQRALPWLRYFGGLHEWSNGRVLAMIHQGGMWRPKPMTPRFEIVDGPRGGRDLPQLSVGERVDQLGNKYRGALVDPMRMVAFRSGHVYAIGEGGYEWFAPGQSKGVIVEGQMPVFADAVAKLGERTLFLSTRNGITKIDGDAVEAIRVPPAPRDSWNTHLAVADDGTLWFAHQEGDLQRRNRDGSWSIIAIPSSDGAPRRHVVTGLTARGNHVWVAASDPTHRNEAVLAWTGEPPEALSRIHAEGDGWAPMQIATRDLDRPKIAAEGCKSVFALFYGITKYAGPDYDFPKTREALKGKPKFATARFVKTDVGGQQFFGAFAKDLKQGKELIDLVAKDVEGSAPQLLCHEPKVIAELGIDFATGNSKGWTQVK